MRKFLLPFFILTVLSSQTSSGAIKKSSDLFEIKDELGKKARETDTIAASIKSLENRIGKMNSQYLERAREERQLNEKLSKLQSDLQERMKGLEVKRKKASELARVYALEAGDNEDQNALLKETILKKLLRERVATILELKKETSDLQKTVVFYSEQLSEAKNNEETLYSLIVDLENKKKDLSQSYISQLEKKNELEEKLETAQARKQAYKSVKKTASASFKMGPLSLVPPLETFVSFKSGDKGVTFKYDSRAPIKASAGGKVVYAGELASYGKVVMIDHGQEIRSVILGDIQIKARKGDQVKQGQILGYTLAEPGLKKSLYYEVRKRNVAQNTIALLEKQGTKI